MLLSLAGLILFVQVWEGEGVIKYGRKLIGATDPQKSEPGTIRGDLAVVVGRYILLLFLVDQFYIHDFLHHDLKLGSSFTTQKYNSRQ